uniref:Sugar O-methyltransferase n=1 Tax=viral metagenome TaxID=1070528 RepID=A0A6C0HYK5_9ZZZZ
MAYENYEIICNKNYNLDVKDWNFKSNSEYTKVLEHVNNQQANLYLKQIISEFEDIYINNKFTLIDICNKNDLYGKTIKNDFVNFTSCSPSNLRYIYQSFKILSYINSLGLNNIDFVEIGGGYGGLCFFINKLAGIFNINIKSYTIFDLLYPSLLTKKYLLNLGIENTNHYQLNNFQNISKNSFLISSYAFSELPENIRIEYQEKIINPYTIHGFIAWNGVSVYNFKKNTNLKIIDNFYTQIFNNKSCPYVFF